MEFGENDPIRLRAMGNLAIAYDYQGKYRDAEVLFKQCLDKQKVAIGENHPFTLDAMHSLALASYNQEKYRDAEALFKQ